MSVHCHPIRLWKPLTKAAAVSVLGAVFGSVLPAPPTAADEIKRADEIVRSLSGPPAAGADTPVLRFRGVRPRPKPKPASEPQAGGRVDLTVHFATDSAVIEPRSQDQIREIAAAARQLDLSPAQLWIVGHTDSRGPAAHNLRLSQRRARAVRQALVTEHGLPSDDLRVDGKGETELLIDPERGPADLARNRRVELRLLDRRQSTR